MHGWHLSEANRLFTGLCNYRCGFVDNMWNLYSQEWTAVYMKYCIYAIFAILLSSSAHAGTVKLTWTSDEKGTDGTPVTLTQFNAFWNVQATTDSGVIKLGPPLPAPWKNNGGVYTWSKTLSNDIWEPGVTICFYMTAMAGMQESSPSNTVCKVMSSIPSQPILINIGESP